MPFSAQPLAAIDLLEALVFPAILLLIGGVLTGASSWLAANRQRREKEHELQVELVSAISEEVMTMLTTVQFVQLGSASVSNDDLDDAYKRWEIESAVIGTKLRAYFPEEDLAPSWTDFASRVTRFYALLGIPDEDDRADARGQLLGSDSDAASEQAEWLTIRNRLLHDKSKLIGRVMSGEGIRVGRLSRRAAEGGGTP